LKFLGKIWQASTSLLLNGRTRASGAHHAEPVRMLSEPPADRGHERSPIRRLGPVIGVLASLLLCVQNVGAGTGAAWAAIHGAGLLALVAFLPLALGLGLLWAGFLYLKGNPGYLPLLLFAGHAVMVLLLTELLHPATPLKEWWTQRTLMSGEVLSIRDDVATTSTGEPIGLGVTYEVRFSRRFVGTIYTAQITSPEAPAPLFPLAYHRAEAQIEPRPTSSDIQQVFERGVVYRVTVTAMPSFRFLIYGTGRACRDTPPGMSDDEILAALRQVGTRRDRLSIFVGNGESGTATVTEYLTSPYDLEAMYRSVIREGLEPCRR
jgi:hypothetical protein